MKSVPPKVAHQTIDDWLKEALREGDVQQATSPPRVTSPIFIIPKKTPGQYRLIFDLRYVNSYLAPPRFKMESWTSAVKAVRSGCYFTKTDLKSGYSHVQIRPSDRKYLGFSWRNQDYVYNVLPFGLSISPWIFTKMLRPVLLEMRRRAVQIFAYVDDILLVSDSIEACRRETLELRALLARLGWIINPEKSSVVPTTHIEFLGFIIDSNEMVVRLPRGKSKSVSHELFRFARRAALEKQPKRRVARILGLANSVACVIPAAPMLARRLVQSIRAAFGPWSATIDVAQEALQDLLLLAELIRQADPRPINPPQPTMHLQSDASLHGYGSVCLETSRRVAGSWESHPALSQLDNNLWSINVLELLAAFQAVKDHYDPSRPVVAIELDNATAVSYLTRWTGRVPLLCELARSIRNWCEERGLTIIATFIPGKQNVIADEESRRAMNWSLSADDFKRICKQLRCKPTIDRFASKGNHLLPRWNARVHHPEAEATDAMKQPWLGEFNYLAPPLPLLEKAIHKLLAEKANALLITPPWERPWLPALLRAACSVMVFPSSCLRGDPRPFEASSSSMLAWKICAQSSSVVSPLTRRNWWSQIVTSKNWRTCTPTSESF